MLDQLSASLAATVQAARIAQDLSVNALAERSGVSRAMIGKIERGEAQPTAVLLGRLSGALGMTLSELVARAENTGDLLRRAPPTSRPGRTPPPATAAARSHRSPTARWNWSRSSSRPAPRSRIPADAYIFKYQQLWILDGHLRFHEGPVIHDLHTGDCLQLGPPSATHLPQPVGHPCRYLVALVKGRS